MREQGLGWKGAALIAGLASAFLAAPSRGADPEPVVILDVVSPTVRDEVPSAAPPRFVLHSDGLVFTGGTSAVYSGRLDKKEMKALERRIDRIRTLSGISGGASLGKGPHTYRLRVPKARLEILAKGDPSEAPSPLAPLASLLVDLASFHHPSLRPYPPSAYLLAVRQGELVGGCRSWSFPVPLAAALETPRTVTPESSIGWPTGASPASVCEGGKRYVVTLTPVVPGIP